MNSRERVLAALNHQQPDRPPRDLGSTTATGIHPTAYQALKAHLGLEPGFEYMSSRAFLCKVEQPVLEHFGIDLLPIITAESGTPPVLDENRGYVDGWKVERRLPTDGGHYFVSHSPIADLTTVEELANYDWPEPRLDYEELKQQALYLREHTDKALMLNLNVGFLHQTQFMRGFDRWLMDLAADSNFACAYMDYILDIWLAESVAMMEAVKGIADVVIYADDIAFQNGPMVSGRMYRKLLKPRQKRVFDAMKSSGMKVLYHSCGALETIMDDLIEMGVDALNPVQVSAKGMGETAELKKRWGDQITFWGGVDTQYVMPRGTTQEVRDEVTRRLNDLSAGGGYVLATVHDVQAEVPPENVVAMFAAADEWEANA